MPSCVSHKKRKEKNKTQSGSCGGCAASQPCLIRTAGKRESTPKQKLRRKMITLFAHCAGQADQEVDHHLLHARVDTVAILIPSCLLRTYGLALRAWRTSGGRVQMRRGDSLAPRACACMCAKYAGWPLVSRRDRLHGLGPLRMTPLSPMCAVTIDSPNQSLRGPRADKR